MVRSHFQLDQLFILNHCLEVQLYSVHYVQFVRGGNLRDYQ